MWRYAIGRGDEDPARAEFVEQVEARLRTDSSQERRRQAAKKATETLRAKLRAAGIDPHAYFSMLAQRGNAARWRKNDAAPLASEAAEAAERVKECAPGPPQAEAAPAGAVAEDGQARAQALARGVQALTGQAEDQSVTGAQVPQAIAADVHRPGELPAHLL